MGSHDVRAERAATEFDELERILARWRARAQARRSAGFQLRVAEGEPARCDDFDAEAAERPTLTLIEGGGDGR